MVDLKKVATKAIGIAIKIKAIVIIIYYYYYLTTILSIRQRKPSAKCYTRCYTHAACKHLGQGPASSPKPWPQTHGKRQTPNPNPENPRGGGSNGMRFRNENGFQNVYIAPYL